MQKRPCPQSPDRPHRNTPGPILKKIADQLTAKHVRFSTDIEQSST